MGASFPFNTIMRAFSASICCAIPSCIADIVSITISGTSLILATAFTGCFVTGVFCLATIGFCLKVRNRQFYMAWACFILNESYIFSNVDIFRFVNFSSCEKTEKEASRDKRRKENENN